MSNVTFKRGTTKELQKEELQDGLISFTTDDGRIHLDYIDENNELKRQTLYAGTLTIGPHKFNGTKDVSVNEYDGSVETN